MLAVPGSTEPTKSWRCCYQSKQEQERRRKEIERERERVAAGREQQAEIVAQRAIEKQQQVHASRLKRAAAFKQKLGVALTLRRGFQRRDNRPKTMASGRSQSRRGEHFSTLNGFAVRNDFDFDVVCLASCGRCW